MNVKECYLRGFNKRFNVCHIVSICKIFWIKYYNYRECGKREMKRLFPHGTALSEYCRGLSIQF
jgi:hypothetical protein